MLRLLLSYWYFYQLFYACVVYLSSLIPVYLSKALMPRSSLIHVHYIRFTSLCMSFSWVFVSICYVFLLCLDFNIICCALFFLSVCSFQCLWHVFIFSLILFLLLLIASISVTFFVCWKLPVMSPEYLWFHYTSYSCQLDYFNDMTPSTIIIIIMYTPHFLITNTTPFPIYTTSHCPFTTTTPFIHHHSTLSL